MDGDFLKLLPENPLARIPGGQVAQRGSASLEATTIFAFHYSGGVMVCGDHRATAGNIVFSDQIEKILSIDDQSILAIAGSPAVAMEMARTLQTSFEFYRRSQLQSMSLRAKTRALSRLLKENMPATVQGIGVVSPLFAGLDEGCNPPAPVIYFYDPLGAQFEAAGFAASGSGATSIRSVLSHLENWGQPRPSGMSLEEAIRLANRLLRTAAEFDTATGGVDPESGKFATVKTLTAKGIRDVGRTEQAQALQTTDSAAKT